MPFSLRLAYEEDEPVIFKGWIEGAFGELLVEDSPFAHAERNGVVGFLVVNGMMVLSDRADIEARHHLGQRRFLDRCRR